MANHSHVHMNTAVRLYACASALIIYMLSVISRACETQRFDFARSLKSRINLLDGLQVGGSKAKGQLDTTNSPGGKVSRNQGSSPSYRITHYENTQLMNMS